MTSLLQKLWFAWACCFLVQAEEQHGDRTITQVVTLLQEMLDKSKADGVTERELYSKYKCYCDHQEEEKKSEISTLQTQISLLESQIEEILSASSDLSREVTQLKKDMAANTKSRSDAEDLRQVENTAFIAREADLKSAINTSRDAIAELAAVGADQTFSVGADHTQYMAGTNDGGSFVSGTEEGQASAPTSSSASAPPTTQAILVNLASSLKHTLIAASAFVGHRQAAAVDAFLQGPFTSTYTAQSGEVVGILKDMRKTFLTYLSDARREEAKAQAAHDKFMENMEAAYNLTSNSHIAKKLLLSGNDASLASKRPELQTAREDLASAQTFLSSLLDMCSTKKTQYQNRVDLRTKEDAAIAEAIAILNSDAAFASFGTVSATRDGPVALVQFRSIQKHVHSAQDAPRKSAQRFLQRAASAKHSLLLEHVLSLLQANNPFTVVLEEIDKMVALIASEETADDEQKSWCDTTRTDTQSSIGDKSNQITTLEAAIGQLKTDIDDPETGLKKVISDVEASLLENHNSQVTETEARRQANAEYQADVANLAEVQRLLVKAIEVLDRYYAKITAEMQGTGFIQKKKDNPNPPAAWEGVYAGQSTKGGNAIGMLRTILSNTKDEEKQAHSDELSDQHSYEDRMTQLKSEEGTKQASLASHQESLALKEQDLMEKKKNKKATEKERTALEAYLEEIKPGCDFIVANIDARKAHRADEKAALENAKTLLQDTPAYVEAVAAAHNESLGDCLAICAGAEDHVKCKACRASVSIPGYCAGNPSTVGC